jgi:hypothetical protein
MDGTGTTSVFQLKSDIEEIHEMGTRLDELLKKVEDML